MTVLSQEQIEENLAGMNGWRLVEGEIQKTYEHENFVNAIAFVNRVADIAEAANHHPDILIQWNRVTLTISTHSEGGLTRKDFDLASKTDADHG